MATKTEQTGNAFGLIGIIGLPLLLILALIQSQRIKVPEEDE